MRLVREALSDCGDMGDCRRAGTFVALTVPPVVVWVRRRTNGRSKIVRGYRRRRPWQSMPESPRGATA